MTETNGTGRNKERQTLYVNEWPEADRLAWQEACRPTIRLKKGGSASHLAAISQEDIARRYGLFLGFLRLSGRLDRHAAAATQVTPANIEAYMRNITGRKLSSVTAWNCIYKVRRAAQLLSPSADFNWLTEIEKDLAFVMQPRSKFDRLVMAEWLLEAGLALIIEAKDHTRAEFTRARGIRNGFMLALLALYPMRRKNFAALAIGKTFRQVKGGWWITLPRGTTKMGQPEERPVAEWLEPYIKLYLNEARPVLLDPSLISADALWIASNTGGPMAEGTVGSLIKQITQETIGIGISPHLFRTAGATTAAICAGDMPHLASALLGHTHPRVAHDDYIRTSSLTAANKYAALVQRRYLAGRTG
jgi:integrase